MACSPSTCLKARHPRERPHHWRRRLDRSRGAPIAAQGGPSRSGDRHHRFWAPRPGPENGRSARCGRDGPPGRQRRDRCDRARRRVSGPVAAQREAASRAAGITDLHFHDIRGTAITMLAEAGCTTPQIAAITGHSLKTVTTILDKYLAPTRVLASEAVKLFENARSTEFANRLQTGPQQGGRNGSKSLK